MITKIETRQDGAGKVVVEQKYNHLAPIKYYVKNSVRTANAATISCFDLLNE